MTPRDHAFLGPSLGDGDSNRAASRGSGVSGQPARLYCFLHVYNRRGDEVKYMCLFPFVPVWFLAGLNAFIFLVLGIHEICGFHCIDHGGGAVMGWFLQVCFRIDTVELGLWEQLKFLSD